MISALLANALCACVLLPLAAVREVQLRPKRVVVIYRVGLVVDECGEWQLTLTAGVSDCVGGCCYDGVL